MFLLGFRRKLTALALCKSIESAIQWFQIHHKITFPTIQNPAVYLSGARVSIFSTLVPRLILEHVIHSDDIRLALLRLKYQVVSFRTQNKTVLLSAAPPVRKTLPFFTARAHLDLF